MTVGNTVVPFSKLSIADEHFVQSKRLLNGMSVASNRRELQSVLKIATISFDHDIAGIHDEEIRAGAASVLCQCLLHALQDQDNNNITEAVRICKVLSMIYRCSNPIATHSMIQVGTPLLQILLETGESCREFRVAAEELIDRLSSLNVPLGSLLHYDKLLCFLIKTISPDDDDKSDKIDVWPVLHGTRVLAGLTSHSDSKAVAFACDGLVNTVIDTVQNVPDAYVRQEAATILRNLAWETKIKADMILIRKKRSCIGALVKLCSSRENPRTRAHAVEAVKYLSVEARNKTRLVFYDDGAVVRALIKVLRDESLPIEPRLFSIGTLSSLVSRETSHCIGRQSGLLRKLASVASSCEHAKLALLSAQTVKNLATYINVHFRCHEPLLDAIMTMASSCKTDGTLLWTCKALVQQSLLPGCSFFMARSPCVLDTLTSLMVDSKHPSSVKASATEAVGNLAKDGANAEKLATNAALLEALVDGAGSSGSAARQHAVKALISLANHGSTTKRVAKQYGLVESLASFGISQDENDKLKRAAIQSVVLLAPLL